MNKPLFALSILSTVININAETMKNKALSGVTKTPDYKVSGPEVSVVIPTLQEEEYIESLLMSISNQTYEPIQIIVADSSPPDSKELTREILYEYGAFMLDCPEKNVGLQKNEGAKAATGKILSFIDADCILAQDYVERMVTALTNGAILAHGVYCCHDSHIKNLLMSSYRFLKTTSHTSGSGITMNRDDFFYIGGFDDKCEPFAAKCREDLDLGRRVKETWGADALFLDRGAIFAHPDRRAFTGLTLWGHRGWRKRKPIEGRDDDFANNSSLGGMLITPDI